MTTALIITATLFCVGCVGLWWKSMPEIANVWAKEKMGVEVKIWVINDVVVRHKEM